MDDRKNSPASRCAGLGSESVPIAADAGLQGRRQVDAYCFHGDELGQGLAAALRIMGFDLHGLQGGIEPGPEPGSPTRRNTDDIDPQ
jgi:hypothetical protein